MGANRKIIIRTKQLDQTPKCLKKAIAEVKHFFENFNDVHQKVFMEILAEKYNVIDDFYAIDNEVFNLYISKYKRKRPNASNQCRKVVELVRKMYSLPLNQKFVNKYNEQYNKIFNNRNECSKQEVLDKIRGEIFEEFVDSKIRKYYKSKFGIDRGCQIIINDRPFECERKTVDFFVHKCNHFYECKFSPNSIKPENVKFINELHKKIKESDGNSKCAFVVYMERPKVLRRLKLKKIEYIYEIREIICLNDLYNNEFLEYDFGA